MADECYYRLKADFNPASNGGQDLPKILLSVQPTEGEFHNGHLVKATLPGGHTQVLSKETQLDRFYERVDGPPYPQTCLAI